MHNFNPWIDVGIIAVFMIIMTVVALVGDYVTKKNTVAPRGATRL